MKQKCFEFFNNIGRRGSSSSSGGWFGSRRKSNSGSSGSSWFGSKKTNTNPQSSYPKQQYTNTGSQRYIIFEKVCTYLFIF